MGTNQTQKWSTYLSVNIVQNYNTNIKQKLHQQSNNLWLNKDPMSYNKYQHKTRHAYVRKKADTVEDFNKEDNKKKSKKKELK